MTFLYLLLTGKGVKDSTSPSVYVLIIFLTQDCWKRYTSARVNQETINQKLLMIPLSEMKEVTEAL